MPLPSALAAPANIARMLSTLQIAPFVLCLLVAGHAAADTIDFEGLSDSTIVTTQYTGLTFSNAIILTAGISLNEFEFPPHSGTNVVSDSGGAITITFSNPVATFSAYFTYLTQLTLVGYNAANAQVTQATSAFSNNMALSGDPGSTPNELLQLNFNSGISSITMSGDPAGGSFVMDDLSSSPATVPEPGSLGLFILALLGMIAVRRLQLI